MYFVRSVSGRTKGRRNLREKKAKTGIIFQGLQKWGEMVSFVTRINLKNGYKI